MIFALAGAPTAIARSLLDDVVEADARLAWHGDAVGPARTAADEVPLEHVEYVVFDLETTGLSAGRDRICEIGAQRVVELELRDTFETLADPGVSTPPRSRR